MDGSSLFVDPAYNSSYLGKQYWSQKNVKVIVVLIVGLVTVSVVNNICMSDA